MSQESVTDGKVQCLIDPLPPHYGSLGGRTFVLFTCVSPAYAMVPKGYSELLNSLKKESSKPGAEVTSEKIQHDRPFDMTICALEATQSSILVAGGGEGMRYLRKNIRLLDGNVAQN